LDKTNPNFCERRVVNSPKAMRAARLCLKLPYFAPNTVTIQALSKIHLRGSSLLYICTGFHGVLRSYNRLRLRAHFVSPPSGIESCRRLRRLAEAVRNRARRIHRHRGSGMVILTPLLPVGPFRGSPAPDTRCTGSPYAQRASPKGAAPVTK